MKSHVIFHWSKNKLFIIQFFLSIWLCTLFELCMEQTEATKWTEFFLPKTQICESKTKEKRKSFVGYLGAAAERNKFVERRNGKRWAITQNYCLGKMLSFSTTFILLLILSMPKNDYLSRQIWWVAVVWI